MASPVKKLLLATGNPGKIEEIGGEFRKLGVDTTSPATQNFQLERPEAGNTYRENAHIKAEEGYEKSDLAALADDSGLEVDALDGKPGVRSARWGDEDASDESTNQMLLKKLDGVPTDKRTARFVCSMVLFDASGERIATRGVCEGRIAEKPRGENGFGYDPVFEVKETGWATFAELDSTIKEWISHRGKALNELISRMKTEGLLPEDKTSH
jgi:XTP/dITP diphosphohydrolase